MENILFRETPYLFRGLLLWFTALILVCFSYVFVALFLQERQAEFKMGESEEMNTNYKLIVMSYLTCVTLALWALLTTYFVGPGYSKDHFKSVKIDPITIDVASDKDEKADESNPQSLLTSS